MVKVSIIVPVYNAEDYLEQCITSIIKQTMKDIEIILINDNSKDNSNNICKSFLQRDSRISLYQSNGKGVSAARNIGIEKAKGDWLCFVDSDDWMEEDMIEKLYKIADSGNSDIVMCDTFINQDNNQIIGEFYPEEKTFENKDREILQIQSVCLLDKFKNTSIIECGVPWSKLYKREFIISNNIKYKENLPRRQDMIFNLEAFEKANSINYKKLNLYHYRKHSASKVRRFAPNVCYEYNNILSELEKFMEDYKKKNLLKESYEKMVIKYFNAFARFFININNNLSMEEKLKQYNENLNNDTFLNILKITRKHWKLKLFNFLCQRQITIGLCVFCNMNKRFKVI